MKARKVGSTYPITFTLRDQAGARNLTGSTVTLSMRDARTGVKKISGAAVTVVSAAAGTCKYVVQAANVDTDAVNEIEVREVRADGTLAFYPSSGYEPLTIEESFA